MKKLSERLELVRDKFGMAYGDAGALDEAAELARSFEAAPVRVVKTCRENGGHGMSLDVQSVTIGHDMDGAIIPSLEGKRVRIVPEREG